MFAQTSFIGGLIKLGNIIKFHLMFTDPDGLGKGPLIDPHKSHRNFQILPSGQRTGWSLTLMTKSC